MWGFTLCTIVIVGRSSHSANNVIGQGTPSANKAGVIGSRWEHYTFDGERNPNWPSDSLGQQYCDSRWVLHHSPITGRAILSAPYVVGWVNRQCACEQDRASKDCYKVREILGWLSDLLNQQQSQAGVVGLITANCWLRDFVGQPSGWPNRSLDQRPKSNHVGAVSPCQSLLWPRESLSQHGFWQRTYLGKQ